MLETKYKRTTSVFQIDRRHFELQDLVDPDRCIRFICEAHHASLENAGEAINLSTTELNGIGYHLYHFEAYEGPSAWENFIPRRIAQSGDFRVRTLSFVLFMVVDEHIFCVVAGSGMMAIKRFINHHFGTDLYERICIPEEDHVISITARGVTGNNAASSSIPRNELLVLDALQFGMVPTNMTIELSEHISQDVFGFISAIENRRVIIEVSSFFKLNTKISFDELHDLVKLISNILSARPQKHLTCFVRVEDKEIADGRYTQQLLTELRDDMVRRNGPSSSQYSIPKDIDFMHPSKLESFVECEVYKVFLKDKEKPAFEVQDRRNIYKDCLKFIYQKYPGLSQFDFNKLLMSSRVKGYKGDRQLTTATILQHITCEIEFNGRPVFHVDTAWYEAKGNFEAEINGHFSALLSARNQGAGLFNVPWVDNMRTEADYNNAYANNSAGRFFVLDTITQDNIELCDVLVWENDQLNLVHVKRGFDTSMRDLSYQVLLSAKRLASDRNSGEFKYLKEVVRKYNEKGTGSIDFDELVTAMKTHRVKYTMAIARPRKDRPPIFTNHESYKSNIAKFALIETSKQMSTGSFGFGLVEIDLA